MYIPAKQRFYGKYDWLKSYYIFSFAEYVDPLNMNFWKMRVFNDDVISGNKGFDMHRHDNMEILTIVLEGEITHEDNMGNKGVIKAWEIQTMSAGSGVFHSEKNETPEKVHLYQLWFTPKLKNLPPSYKTLAPNLKENALTHLASWHSSPEVWFLHADVEVYRAIYDAKKRFEYSLENGKWLFVYVTSGKLTIWEHTLKAWDQIRYSESGSYDFEIHKASDFILIETSLVWA